MDHPFPFDPTYGYDLDRLLTVPAPEGPADFADFWRRTYEESRAMPLDLAHRKITSTRPDYDVYEVEYNALGGVHIGGWLTVPRDEPARRGMVVGHGYDGRSEPAFEPGTVALSPCARGFNRSAHPTISGEHMRHVLNGIQSRETYSHRGCVADLWSAATALLELHPEFATSLDYSGTSFGGGIGALMLPWDSRFRRGFLSVPSFGNHGLRLQMQCTGSGEAVRSYHRRHSEVTQVLAYFDAATAARHIRIPVLVAAALFDPAVPPPGQFAVYNGLAGERELFVLTAGHFPYPAEADEAARLAARLADWWS